MATERDEKEDKAMAATNDVRRAHKILLGLRPVISKEQEELLRSFLPELPTQMTLEEIRREVYDVWAGTNGNEWPDDIHDDLETWLSELDIQLQGLENNAKPAHPEFLETEADYAAAPNGTIVASDGNLPCHKFQSKWASIGFIEREDDKAMSRFSRQVLRWGWA